MSSVRPTREEFVSFAREQFVFLTLQFGFTERECPEERFSNPFKLCYAGHGIVIYIEGINWGIGAQAFVARDEIPLRPLPLWPLISDADMGTVDSTPVSSQLTAVTAEANRVRRLPETVLYGDLRIVEEAWRAHLARVAPKRQ